MSKIELTIAPDYVPTWTVVDAVRELFQNALDQEKQNPENVASWEYSDIYETMSIRNATSKLTAQSLLLGSTSKAGDTSTIGQFGEGYKIATLVLLRNNKKVTFYNYGAREIWRPRFVKSRRFGTDILTFFIEKPKVWEKVPSADLIIEVEGITNKEWYDLIVPSNLHLRHEFKADYNIVESTQYGDIIDLPGQVYVNGLFVCYYAPYKYGYNFTPENIKLDRDRKMVSDFDLRWMASKMWSGTNNRKAVMEMLTAGAADVAYLDSVSFSRNWRDIAAEEFMSVYGPEAIPVTSQDELLNVPKGYKGVIVSVGYNELIRGSSRFTMPVVKEDEGLLDDLLDWFASIQEKLTVEEVSRFDEVISKLSERL